MEVDIHVDTEPRDVAIPEALKLALSRDETAQAAFDALSYSRQRWFALNVESAKTDATRDKRVRAAIAQLCAQPTD